jgi:hypothetical protein
MRRITTAFGILVLMVLFGTMIVTRAVPPAAAAAPDI